MKVGWRKSSKEEAGSDGICPGLNNGLFGGVGGDQVDEIRGQESNFESDLKGNVRMDKRFDELRSYKGQTQLP